MQSSSIITLHVSGGELLLALRMGNLFATNKGVAEIRVGMLGLDNAGKTTILYRLKQQQHWINSSSVNAHPPQLPPPLPVTVPTIGFNVETIRCDKYMLNIWDVGGNQPRTRTLWQHYNQNVRVIIFVVDAADRRRLADVVDEFRWLWWREELSKAVFLIFANKQDMPNALGAEDLVQLLELPMLEQRWTVQECCALTGDGLWDGLQQVEKMLISNSRHNNAQFLMCSQ